MQSVFSLINKVSETVLPPIADREYIKYITCFNDRLDKLQVKFLSLRLSKITIRILELVDDMKYSRRNENMRIYDRNCLISPFSG